MIPNETYLVAATKSWNRQIFDETICHFPGTWHFIANRDDLTPHTVENLNPSAIFFLHWSWKVPAEIYERYECVCFHMTDLPYGRGGSPLQNLIVRGHKTTRLTALKMVEELDAGPVYLKRDLDLSGSAKTIFRRASSLAVEMIETFVKEQPEPRPQEGEVVVFSRRKPRQSRIPDGLEPEAIYDYIRMLDAEGYPKAFVEQGGNRYTFSDAVFADGKVTAKVVVTATAIEK